MRKVVAILGAIIVLVSILGFSYPFVGQYINSITHAKVIRDYQSQVDQLSELQAKQILSEAREYNKWIFGRGSVTDLTDEEMDRYNSVLDMSVSGIMGYLEIPKIDVQLPIYHGTEEKVLQVGVGHLAGSSIPIGGMNTHTVLTGHSGLPASKLFTDLDRLTIGDTFTITVLDNVITYQVDSTEVVLPEDAEVTIDEGADRCTLVTCTPIGANTHRLLVHAHRIENIGPESDAEVETDLSTDTETTAETVTTVPANKLSMAVILAIVTGLLVIAFGVAYFVIVSRFNRKEKDRWKKE